MFSKISQFAENPSARSIGLVLLGLTTVGVVFGKDVFSYLRTFRDVASEEVRENFSIQFELERARGMVLDLMPEIRQKMVAVAEDEVAVKHSNEDLVEAEQELDEQKSTLLKLRAELASPSGAFKVGIRPATGEELKEELKRRFSRFQTSEATLVVKRDIAATRMEALRNSRAQFQDLVNAARDLDAQIEQMEARIRHQEVSAPQIEIDDSQLARCENLIDDIKRRLDVADQLMAAQVPLEDFLFASYVDAETDIGQEIDDYFASFEFESASDKP